MGRGASLLLAFAARVGAAPDPVEAALVECDVCRAALDVTVKFVAHYKAQGFAIGPHEAAFTAREVCDPSSGFSSWMHTVDLVASDALAFEHAGLARAFGVKGDDLGDIFGDGSGYEVAAGASGAAVRAAASVTAAEVGFLAAGATATALEVVVGPSGAVNRRVRAADGVEGWVDAEDLVRDGPRFLLVQDHDDGGRTAARPCGGECETIAAACGTSIAGVSLDAFAAVAAGEDPPKDACPCFAKRRPLPTQTPRVFDDKAPGADVLAGVAVDVHGDDHPLVRLARMNGLDAPPREWDMRTVAAKGLEQRRGLAALAEPWRDWTPCDEAAAYEARCAPEAATCEADVPFYSHKGLGNALLTGYVPSARAALARGCAPKFDEEKHRPATVSDERGARAPAGAAAFRLQAAAVVPTVVPTNLSDACVLQALTAPTPAVAARVRRAQRGTDAALPLVAFHLRTGWADTSDPSAKDGWATLGTCARFQERYANATDGGLGVASHDGSLGLSGLLRTVSDAADAAFGARHWRAFVASDAPAARDAASAYLEGRCDGGAARNDGGVLGHNADTPEAGESALSDLLLLAEADFLVYLTSKFPAAAARRRACPARSVDVGRPTRHAVFDLGPLLTTGLKARREGQMTQDAAGPPGQKPRSPLYLPGPARRELAKIVGFDAAGGPHRCLDDADPLESCACFFRIAHEGA